MFKYRCGRTRAHTEAAGRSPVTLGAVGNPTLATTTFLLGILLAPPTASQADTTSKPQKPKPDDEAQKQARRWVTFLEVDDRRAEADEVRREEQGCHDRQSEADRFHNGSPGQEVS